MLQFFFTNEEIKPTLQITLTNEEIKPPLPRLDASELLVPGGGQVEEPEDYLFEVAALNDEEQEESEADREAAVPEEEVKVMEVPAVVLAVDTPAATYAHKVTEEEDKGDKHGLQWVGQICLPLALYVILEAWQDKG